MYINSRKFPLNHFYPQRNLHHLPSLLCVGVYRAMPEWFMSLLWAKFLVSFALCTVEWAGGIWPQWSFIMGRREGASLGIWVRLDILGLSHWWPVISREGVKLLGMIFLCLWLGTGSFLVSLPTPPAYLQFGLKKMKMCGVRLEWGKNPHLQMEALGSGCRAPGLPISSPIIKS